LAAFKAVSLPPCTPGGSILYIQGPAENSAAKNAPLNAGTKPANIHCIFEGANGGGERAAIGAILVKLSTAQKAAH